MASKKIGVDLGKHTIKFAFIEESSDVFKERFVKMYPVKHCKNDKAYYSFLRKCVKDFLRVSKVRNPSFCFTVPHDSMNSNICSFKMPIVDKKALQKSLKYELEEKGITEDVESIYYDWTITNSSTSNEDKQYAILVATIKKNIIRELGKLKKLQWKIENIELQPITIGRLIRGNTAVMDFGFTSTRVYIYLDGHVVGIEKFDFGGRDLNDIICNEIGISDFVEIEKFKEKCFLVGKFYDEDKPIQVLNVSKQITNKVRDLFENIKRYVRGFELQNNMIVENIYSIGGTSNLTYFNDYLAKEFELNVKEMNVITPKDTDTDEKLFHYYNLAASATMHDSYKYYNDLNLSKFTKFELDFTPILSLSLCASVFMHYGAWSINSKYDKNVESVSNIQMEQDKTINDLTNQIQSFDYSDSENNRIIQIIEGIDGYEKFLSDILYVLPKKVPAGVAIKRIVCKEGVVYINGYTKNYSDVGFLAIALEEIGNVIIDEIKDDTGGQIVMNDSNKLEKEFRITMYYSQINQ